ncbi:MBG domain-containing protein [Flavobacterium sp. GNP001]
MKKQLLFFMALFWSAWSFGQTFTAGGIRYNVTSATAPLTVQVGSHGNFTGIATIPATVTNNGITYSVTAIGDGAFRRCISLTSVTIPNSVTSIGLEAFKECISLTSVTIPDSVTSIGFGAFVDCWKLTSVTIPNSVTSIGEFAFTNCTSLTSVTIPNSVTSIGSGVFLFCTSLTSVTIPNSVTSIGSSAFLACTSLTSVTIPNSVISIGSRAFERCTSLTSVTIPNSVTFIGSSAFQGCRSLTSVTIPNSVTSIGSSAFQACTSLTSATIPNSVTSIGSSVFQGCTSLTSVSIPNSVTSISSSVFQGCTSLTSVTIPNSVTSIGEFAFQDCTSLASITIPNSVTSIGNYAFRRCKSLTSVTIGNSVASIGSGAFSDCEGLPSVTIPNSVTSIRSEAFGFCTGLTSVTIGNSVTAIEGGAFLFCINLKTVNCYVLNPIAIDFQVFQEVNLPACALNVPTGSAAAYEAAEVWTEFNPINGNLNNAPTDMSLSVSAINENVAANSTVGTFSSIDADTANTFTYTLVSGTGDTDNASFNISGNNLTINASPDFETKSSYLIRVRTTDQDDLSFEKEFTITVNDRNEVPTDIALSNSVINENIPPESIVATLTTTDADISDRFIYTLVSGTGDTDNASFSISGIYLVNNASPDFETKSSYTVRVRTTDQGDLSFEKEFTITVNDRNEAPTDIALSNSVINENIPAESIVATLTTTDADISDKFIYTLVSGTGDTDNASFSISGIYLVNNASPDFETKSSYTVRVRTTDQDDLSFEKEFTITVNDLSYAPLLTFENINKTYGDANFDLGATSNATGTISYSVVEGTGKVILSGTTNETVELKTVGTVIIRATQDAAGDYSSATKDITLTITAKPITVTADAKTKVYGVVDPSLTYSVSPSLVGTDAFTGTLTRVSGDNVGTYAIEQGTLSAGSNYAITYEAEDFAITAKPITVTADAKTKVYGAVDPSLTYSVSPSLVGTDAFTGTLTRVEGENVGTYAIEQNNLSAGSNYAITYEAEDFAITAKPITVTADAKTKVYGTADPSLTYSVSPSLVGTDAFTGTLARVEGENVNTYAITQGDLSAGSNYTIAYVATDFSITAKPITVTADAKTKVYGTVDSSLTYSVSPSLVGTDGFTGTLTRVTGENVGTYAIAQGTLSAGSNYAITYEAEDFAITAKPITVTADAKTKVYGTADPSLTYSVSPSLVGTDAFTGTLTRVSGENVGTYAIGQNNLSAGSNYTITYVAEDFAITAKAITVTADASQTKMYGTTDPSLTYSVSPSVVGTDVFTGTLKRVSGENVGTYAITQGDLSAGSNYTITYVAKDFAITAKPITVTADAKTKVYGTVDSSLTYSVSPSLVGADGFTGTLARVSGENVGTYVIGQNDLSAGSNYTITYVAKDFAITAKAITVIADAKTKVYGTLDPILTYSVSPSLVGTDVFTGTLKRVSGENVGTYAIGQNNLSAGSNYTITYVAKDFAITAKPITVTADAKTKVYGTIDSSLTYSVSPSLVGTDGFTGTLTRVTGENVGTYAIAQGTLSAGANYSVTFVPANYSITKADQVITWNQTLVSDCGGSASIVLTATSTSGLPISYTSSNNNVATFSNGVLNFGNYGFATITANQQGNSNYNAASSIALPTVNSQPNLIRKQFEDVIFFDNSSNEFVAYTWYKNGVIVAGQTAQYFKETGALNGSYYAVATKRNGTLIRTCPLVLTSNGVIETLNIAPNPVRSNSNYQLITNIEAAKMQNARVTVFNILGSLITEKVVNESTIEMVAPSVDGIYIVKLVLSNGKTFTKNLLVRN